MASDKTIANAITKLVDCNYFLGDKSKGWDCLNSLQEFYEACGVTFPREFEDWNEVNYRDKWIYDPEMGRQAFFRFLQTLGEPIDKNYALRGDLLILKYNVSEKPPLMSRPVMERIKRMHPFMRRMINAVLDGKQLLTFPGVYLGNGHIFLIFEKGGKVVPYRFFERLVVEVRRLIK
jgi:hypothetical protein